MANAHNELLKFLYFEGYADSYEEADYLLEYLTDDEYYDLIENVSLGGNKAAKYATQRVTASQARDLKVPRSQRRPRDMNAPMPPVDNSIAAMQARFAKGKHPASSSYVSGATPANAKVLRRSKRRTPSGMATTVARELEARIASGDRNPETARRARAIRDALKNKSKWGTPEARKEEFVLEYLITNQYANDYETAFSILESMSDEWLNAILEDF